MPPRRLCARERVDDLDLLGAGPETGEGVNEPLEPVVRLDYLCGRSLAEHVRLEVDDEGPLAHPLEDVEAAAEQDTVVEERERALGPHPVEPREPAGQWGVAIGADEGGDSFELLVTDGGIPRRDDREVGRPGIGRLDQLEQPVHRVPDLRRCQPAARPLALPTLTQAGDPFGVVPVRTALEERERRVRELANVMEAGLRHLRELRQCEAVQHRCGGHVVEEGELSLGPVRLRGLGRSRARPVDPDEERGTAALELEDGLLAAELGLAVELGEHPADRGVAPIADGTGDEQPVDRARHRDVVEAEALGPPGLTLGVKHLVVAEDAATLARGRVCDLEPEPAVGEGEDLVRRRRAAEVAASIGDDDHLELETLGGVDSEKPHGVGSLLLGDGLQLSGPEVLLIAEKADKAFEVAPAHLLVAAGEPHQLAQVRVASPPVPAREHRQVVVVLRDDELAEALERDAGGGRDEPLEALLEGPDESLVLRRERLWQRALDPREQRPTTRLPADQDEGVIRDADERRSEDRRERLVVVAVSQQAKVHPEVDHLLLPEVAPARRPVGGQAERAKLLLVPLGVGARGEEEHDLTRYGGARVDELAHPPRDRPGLGAAPMLARVPIALLVGDQQLDRVPEHRVGELARRRERLVTVAELLTEDVVDRREYLGPRAVVLRQRQPLRGRRPALAEDADVCVAKAVNRLELIADVEHLLGRPGGDLVDQLTLEGVRVLELVDHDRAEAELLGLANRLVAGQEVAGKQLEVLEVERRLALLPCRVLGREEREQLLEEVLVTRRRQLQRCLLDVPPRLLEAGRAIAARPQRRQVDQGLGERGKVECSLRCGEVVVGRAVIVEQTTGSVAQFPQPAVQVGGRVQLEQERPASRTQRLVDAGQHLAEPAAPVRREQRQPLPLLTAAERLDGAIEGLAAKHGRVLVIELVETGVDPDRERVGAKEAAAEPVDRRDPGAVELTRQVEPAPLGERPPDPGTQLTCGLARIGDHEHRVDVEPFVTDGRDEALDQHRGLAGTGPGRHEDLAACLDGGALVLVHDRSTRHIVQRSHQVGQSPPFGSWATLPARMRRAAARPRSRAVSTWLQNSSSSR